MAEGCGGQRFADPSPRIHVINCFLEVVVMRDGKLLISGCDNQQVVASEQLRLWQAA